VKVKVNNTWALEVPEDRATFFAQRPNWEIKRTQSMFENIKKGDVVIDVGAELGDFPALYATWGAKVICIEPQPKYWPHIKNYFDLNKVEPLACFAGFASTIDEREPALADFELGYDGIWPLCALQPLEDWNGFRNVLETGVSTPQCTIDKLLADYGINHVDMLTIDVEGAEFEVLKGAEITLREAQPLVYLSFHPEMIQRDWGNNFDDITHYMQQFSYDWAFLEKDHEEHWVFFVNKKGKV
jgi:FkbM family methyltransferase